MACMRISIAGCFTMFGNRHFERHADPAVFTCSGLNPPQPEALCRLPPIPGGQRSLSIAARPCIQIVIHSARPLLLLPKQPNSQAIPAMRLYAHRQKDDEFGRNWQTLLRPPIFRGSELQQALQLVSQNSEDLGQCGARHCRLCRRLMPFSMCILPVTNAFRRSK